MSPRTCTQIKTNGTKCGSPALRHHTLCYFHYQWQRRDQRRIRLGGPIGMNKNTGIELPLLDGPEAILLSIMEIQAAILDQRIPIKTATALLYSIQLALQARIPYSGLCGREPVRECPELELELDMERAKAQRPAKEKCAACPKQETCLSPRNCKKLPKLPDHYHREGDSIVFRSDETDSPGAPFKPSVGLSGVVLSDTSKPSSSRAKVAACSSPLGAPHLPRLADVGSALATEVEGPAFSPTEATTLDNPAPPETTTAADPIREHSPGRESGVSAPPKFPPSRAQARRQIVPSEEKQKVLRLRATPSNSAQDDAPSLGTENRELGTKQRRTENRERRTENGEPLTPPIF